MRFGSNTFNVDNVWGALDPRYVGNCCHYEDDYFSGNLKNGWKDYYEDRNIPPDSPIALAMSYVLTL